MGSSKNDNGGRVSPLLFYFFPHSWQRAKINRKFVNEDGYEVVLSNNLSTIIKNPRVYGTFNYYTYKGIEYDTLNHTVDINLWQKYGSGPDDWTTEVQRKKANALAQKLSKVPFFSDQGFKNYLNSRKITKVTPDTYKNYLEIIKEAIWLYDVK